MTDTAAPHRNRRFTVEEIDNGWLMKVNELGSDKLVGRYAYTDSGQLIYALSGFLEKGKLDA